MSTIRNRHFVTGGLFAALSFIASGANARTGNLSGRITDFNLSSCSQKNCIRLNAKTAYVGFLDGSYSADNAVFIVTNTKGASSPRTLHSHDLFYDNTTQKIFLRQIDEKPKQEAYYDLKTEALVFIAAAD